MAGVLLEAGDADSMANTKSQVQVEYFIYLYISTFIRLSNLYWEFYVHGIVVINDGGMRQVGDVDKCRGLGGEGQRVDIIL